MRIHLSTSIIKKLIKKPVYYDEADTPKGYGFKPYGFWYSIEKGTNPKKYKWLQFAISNFSRPKEPKPAYLYKVTLKKDFKMLVIDSLKDIENLHK